VLDRVRLPATSIPPAKGSTMKTALWLIAAELAMVFGVLMVAHV
jgi:hypothetical protein